MNVQSAIITGASKGIGRAVACHLANKGFNLLLIARSKNLLVDLQQELLQKYKNLVVKIAAIDVSHAEEVNKSIMEFYRTTDSIDLLFNNAGYVKRGTSDIDGNELLSMINSNLIGAINLIRVVVPLMKIKNKGYIINLNSRSAEISRSF